MFPRRRRRHRWRYPSRGFGSRLRPHPRPPPHSYLVSTRESKREELTGSVLTYNTLKPGSRLFQRLAWPRRIRHLSAGGRYGHMPHSLPLPLPLRVPPNPQQPFAAARRAAPSHFSGWLSRAPFSTFEGCKAIKDAGGDFRKRAGPISRGPPCCHLRATQGSGACLCRTLSGQGCPVGPDGDLHRGLGNAHGAAAWLTGPGLTWARTQAAGAGAGDGPGGAC